MPGQNGSFNNPGVYIERSGSALAIGDHNSVNNFGGVKSDSSRRSIANPAWSIEVLKHPIFSVQFSQKFSWTKKILWTIGIG
jgi:hypothetical protein